MCRPSWLPIRDDCSLCLCMEPQTSGPCFFNVEGPEAKGNGGQIEGNPHFYDTLRSIVFLPMTYIPASVI